MSDYDDYQNSQRYVTAEDWDKADLATDSQGCHIQRWPSKIGEKRGIKVDVYTWVGYDGGAKHFNVHVDEIDNQFWSEKKNEWVRVSCHSASRGASLMASVFSAKDAVKLAKTYLKMIDPTGKTHAAMWVWSGDERPSWIKR